MKRRCIQSQPWGAPLDQQGTAYLELARVAKELHDEELLRRAVDGVITAHAGVGGRTGTVGPARHLLRAK